MKIKFFFFLFLFLLVSCQKENFDIDNLNGDEVSILGHGGMGISSLYPLNSLESILNCLNYDVDGTEVDIQLSKDSIFVLFHEELLEHSTNGLGPVYDNDWKDIDDIFYIDPFFVEYKVASLERLFKLKENDYDHQFYLDIKNFNPNQSVEYQEMYAQNLYELVQKYNFEDNVVLEIKSKKLIGTFKKLQIDLPIYYYTNDNVEDAVSYIIETELKGIVKAVDKISEDEVKYAHEHGVKVCVFNTLTRRDNREAIRKSVDILQSDKVKYVSNLLR